MNREFFSIDQNSHSLWDTVPKLGALATQGWSGRHFVEDVDVAFTRRGAKPGETDLALVRERYYRGGTLDWGAALFYTDFLGRLPLDLRRLEPYTGWSTAALARRLELSVDALYDQHSPSDNWQLVGASYAGDPHHHRVIGDLGVDEVGQCLRQILDHARRNTETTFPGTQAGDRITAWFNDETARLERLLEHCAGAPLVRLYQQWTMSHTSENVRIGLTSDLLDARRADLPHHALIEAFVSRYDLLAALYNEAIAETGVDLYPLDTAHGELPFFMVRRREGRMVRAPVLLRDNCLVSGDLTLPLAADGERMPVAAMHDAGVLCVVGKALLLVLHARLEPRGRPLALPFMGSQYMPAAHAFEHKLTVRGLLPAKAHPVYRVKLNFFENARATETQVCLPPYLHRPFGDTEMSARNLAEALPIQISAARTHLATLRSPETRDALLRTRWHKLFAERDQLEAQRRELARAPETRPEAGALWRRLKEIDRTLLQRQVAWTVEQLRVAELDYYNSRGALLPWSIALGGRRFYDRLLTDAEIYREPDAPSESGPAEGPA